MKNQKSCSLLAALLVAFSSCVVTSSNGQGSVPVSDPPKLPRYVDYPTMVQYVNHINDGNNAEFLKVGYFMRWFQDAPPVTTGYGLLNKMIAAEPGGSQKWFFGENVKAFAAFRIPSLSMSDGIEAYRLVFNNASKAHGSDSDYCLQECISEFLESVTSKFVQTDANQSPDTRRLVEDAWGAYCISLRNQNDDYVFPEPPFADAIEALGMEKDFGPIVEKAISDPSLNPSFVELITAARISERNNGPLDLKLALREKSLLPDKVDGQKGGFNVTDYVSVYDVLEGAYLSSGDVSKAIAIRKEETNKIGFGYGSLLSLLVNQGDQTAVEAVCGDLGALGVDEREIIRSGRVLLANSNPGVGIGDSYQRMDFDVYDEYLIPGRKKRLSCELTARLDLCGYLLSHGQFSDVLHYGIVSGPVSAKEEKEVSRQIGLLSEYVDVANKAGRDGVKDP